jgi:glutaredoxin
MNYLLFTTTTCPKCPAVKEYIASRTEFSGKILDNTHPEFAEEAAQYGIITAPCCIVFKDGQEIGRGSEVPEIEYLFSQL